LTPETRDKLIGQLQKIFSNPKTAVVGHNFKFDWHMFKSIGIEVTNWWACTMQLAFAAY
jgi:DNA polymerase I-like protein with 3'-5' exonuclease and polymerase domains